MKADVSDIQVEIQVERFDTALFETPPQNLPNRIPELAKKYSTFFDLFSYQIISPARGLADPNFSYSLGEFITNYDMRAAYEDCRKTFPDLAWLEKELSGAFRHHRYYFPDKGIPRVVAFMSGFNYSVVTDSLLLGIGLERYLGPDYRYYPMLQYPKYMTYQMRKEFIATDCMRAWAISEFPFSGTRNFLNEIVYQGKLVYFVRAMMPHLPLNHIMAFTEDELDWCESHEANLWAHFIDKELLYGTDEKTIKEYTSEAPFTPGFPEDAPDRSANWVGYRIVSAYMERKGKSLPELMEETDGQKILQESGYKP